MHAHTQAHIHTHTKANTGQQLNMHGNITFEVLSQETITPHTHTHTHARTHAHTNVNTGQQLTMHGNITFDVLSQETVTTPAPVAQWLAHQTLGRKVWGSNPIRVMWDFSALAGSYPELGVLWAQWEGWNHTAELHPLHGYVFEGVALIT